MKTDTQFNFIIAYNNGHVVRQQTIKGDYLFQVEIGVIRHLIVLDTNEMYIRGEDGVAKKVPLQTFQNP